MFNEKMIMKLVEPLTNKTSRRGIYASLRTGLTSIAIGGPGIMLSNHYFLDCFCFAFDFVSSVWSFGFYIPPQWSMTSEFKGFSFQILSVTFFVLS